MSRALETLHLACLGIMAGIICMTAAAAAVIFPKIKALDPFVASFAEYPKEHWRIVAGQPANTIFQFSGGACLLLLAICAITLALRIISRPRYRASASGAVRFFALVALLGATIYGSFVLETRMHRTARDFWAAAEAGDVAQADQLRDAFSADHPKSQVAMTVRLSLALVALGAGLWHALPVPPPSPKRSQPEPTG